MKVNVFDRELRFLVNDMFDAMYNADGVGLAAVQVGVLKRILIIDLRKSGTKEIFINPHLVESSDEMQEGEEGCLSVPGITSTLKRSRQIKVFYQNILGKKKTIEAENLMARALLHEMDHLDGKIYVDLLEPHEKNKITSDLERLKMGKTVSKVKVPNYRKKISI